MLFLSPILPDAGIDDISHNVLHISYLYGRIIFAIMILIFYYKAIRTRPIAYKIYSSLTHSGFADMTLPVRDGTTADNNTEARLRYEEPLTQTMTG